MAAPRSPSPNLHRKSTTSFAHLKENEKASARPRSPAIQSSKVSKSFMAPTISAASKVTVPSPRKKILQERNESVPPVPEPLEVPAKELAPEIGVKSKMGLASPEIYGGIKNRQTVVAPAEAEQCPPYDPKTTYLSPRPQFLHYRPNPRIENYVAIKRDGKRLEDSFSSESDSDITEVTNVTDGKDSEEEEEPSDATTHVDVHLVQTARVAEPESGPELCLPPHSSRRSKVVPFLVIVAIGCVLVPLSGLHSSSSSGLLEDLHLNDYLAVANVKLYDVAGRVKHWSSDAILHLNDYIAVVNVKLYDVAGRVKHWSSDAIAYLTSMDSREAFISSMNRTTSAEDEAMYSGFIYSHGDKIERVVEEMLAEQYEVEASEVAEDDNVSEKAERVDDADDEIENVNAEATENVPGAEFSAEEFDMEVSDNGETDIEDAAALQEDAKFRVEGVARQVSEIIETCQDFSDKDVEFEMEVAENCATHTEEEIAGQESETIVNHDELGELGLTEEDEISTMSSEAILGLSSAVLLILAVSAFLHVKQGKAPLDTTKGRQTKVPRSQHLGRNKDSMRELCQPEESSSLTDTYHARSSNEEEDDDLRHEMRLRRDSTASSMSYGSFTTYERLSAKKGSKEEEVVTPVRRSSRLRSHATSS